MAFRDNLKRLCRKKNTSISRMCLDLGISKSKTTSINNGRIPTEDMLLQFANYLDCSVMDFFNDDIDTILHQENNDGNISNSIGTNDTYNTNNNYYTTDATLVAEAPTPYEPTNRDVFFQLLDKVRTMRDDQILELLRYADFILSRNEVGK